MLARLTRAIEANTACSPLPDERFDPAHEAFELSSSQQGQILDCLRRLALETRPSAEPMRVLSVGPGNGMLDLPLIAALAEAGVAAQYVGVDPSEVACQRFSEGFKTLRPTGVSLDLKQCDVDRLEGEQRYDLIHAVHSLYYSPNPAETLRRLLARLRPGGKLVIFQAPRAELNALADCFWRADQGKLVWFSDQLGSWLAETGHPLAKQRIDARLDVTRALDPDDPHGQLVLDFVLHTASDKQEAAVVELATDYLRAVSRCKDERWLAPHPVDAFVISPA